MKQGICWLCGQHKKVQPWTKSPFLVNAVFEIDENGNPIFCRYTVSRTSFFEGYFSRIRNTFVTGKFYERLYK